MTKILHFADLHLDRSFAGVGIYSSEASTRREELRAALRRIVDLALDRGVDALTVGGDLYEHDRVTLDTGHFIAQQVNIQVESFIDSGPRVDHSSSHIVPDGEYQEALFRVLESYDPTIEHLGSWHSHHCNGLDRLSDGDIAGYMRSVNNPQYDLDMFLAILVTGTSRGEPLLRFYLFERGLDDFRELLPDDVHVIDAVAPFDDLLRQTETTSQRYRIYRGDVSANASEPPARGRRAARAAPSVADGPSENTATTEDAWRSVRGEDSRWLGERFPQTLRSTLRSRDQSIAWHWQITTTNQTISATYRYPGEGDLQAIASHITFKLGDTLLLDLSVPKSDERFAIISEAIAQATDIAENH